MFRLQQYPSDTVPLALHHTLIGQDPSLQLGRGVIGGCLRQCLLMINHCRYKYDAPMASAAPTAGAEDELPAFACQQQ